MKKIMWGILPLFLLTISCSKNNTEIISDPSTPKLVTPQLRAFVDSPLDPAIPMTGILEVFPCKAGTIYLFRELHKQQTDRIQRLLPDRRRTHL